ncbi:hypothetical protein RxyAA322_23610 [Rubrobacter xylanophilus]|uniref:RDD domain-containing protein n=1 Tax=Rubrobacter xylanophilus TaxID=49319 RepID=A0A510HP76_9ACTN|nr:RDD family protein [Rubrobacter xylanophilus]BBL80507.1 hypothetical protein RxyAA322_23610 [Rubrobacter xylanophilus]
MTTHAAGSAAAPQIHVTGRRILATLVDGLLIAALFFVVALLSGDASATGSGVSAATGPVGTLLMLALVFLYYTLLEGYLGQTVGKMLLGIRVIRESDGGRPGPRAAFIRTLLRLVDGFLWYLVAFVTVLISDKNQRLGDMAAHTLVVRA